MSKPPEPTAVSRLEHYYRSFSALFGGTMTILVGSIVVSVSLSQLTRLILVQSHKGPQEIELFFQNQFEHWGFIGIGLMLNFLVLTGAGWLTAKLAPSVPLWHALVVALIGIAFFILPMFRQVPLWYNLIVLSSTLLGCLMGAYIQKKYEPQ
jgi:hypothetical protein